MESVKGHAPVDVVAPAGVAGAQVAVAVCGGEGLARAALRVHQRHPAADPPGHLHTPTLEIFLRR